MTTFGGVRGRRRCVRLGLLSRRRSRVRVPSHPLL